jgi:hypothetical protein
MRIIIAVMQALLGISGFCGVASFLTEPSNIFRYQYLQMPVFLYGVCATDNRNSHHLSKDQARDNSR